jgi:PIN domain
VIIVFDTNVILAAFLTHGASAEVVEHCIAAHEVFISPFILDEVEDKLRNKFRFPPAKVADLLRYLRDQLEVIEPTWCEPVYGFVYLLIVKHHGATEGKRNNIKEAKPQHQFRAGSGDRSIAQDSHEVKVPHVSPLRWRGCASFGDGMYEVPLRALWETT